MEFASSAIARQYAANRPATAPQLSEGTDGGPGDALLGAGRQFAETLRASESLALDAMTSGADPYAMVQALAQTELAVEAAVTIRNKVVEAYQEILRMPV